MRTHLSPHFTLEELTVTKTGLPNKPPPFAIKNLQLLATQVLEPIRLKFGPFTPTSTYRSLAVNLAVGGKLKSQHMEGKAADITIKNVPVNRLCNWCRLNLPEWDQIIWETKNGSQWMHISFNVGQNRKQVLRLVNGKAMAW